MPYVLLAISIALSSGRNLLSKNLSSAAFGTRRFFARQSILFSCGALAVLTVGICDITHPSVTSLLYGVAYAVLLVFAQWFYTVALGKISTAACSTVYSMGFILPTLSGALFWSESLSVLNIAGILCAAAAILCSADFSKKGSRKSSHGYIPLLIAMLASGGLGIMQKLQQKSAAASERTMFLLIAFTLAALASAASVLILGERGAHAQSEDRSTAAARTDAATDSAISKGEYAVAAGVGIAFGCCNMLNTVLAGMLPSALFFPTLNIGTILLSSLCGILFYREKLQKKTLIVLSLGVASILLLSIK